MEELTPDLGKYYKYSIAAVSGKSLAMLFEAPITLLKTRVEIVNAESMKLEIAKILLNPNQILASFKATVLR